jgi:hypothetical protein
MRPLMLALLLLPVLGCSDDTKPATDTGNGCPATKPAIGSGSCSLPASQTCTYSLPLTCPCGLPPGPSATCVCQQGQWVCTNHNDACLPCPDRGLDGSKKGCVPACGTDQVCVQLFDGTCKTGGPSCKTVGTACLTAGCTAACEKELCSSPYQCQNQVPCGTEQGAQINCYGP